MKVDAICAACKYQFKAKLIGKVLTVSKCPKCGSRIIHVVVPTQTIVEADVAAHGVIEERLKAANDQLLRDVKAHEAKGGSDDSTKLGTEKAS